MAERLTLDAFEPHVGQAFRVRLEDGREVAFVLEAAQDESERDPRRPAELPAPFSLLFRAPPDVVLSSGMHELHHEGLGTVTLGLGPIVTLDRVNGVLHEAVFN